MTRFARVLLEKISDVRRDFSSLGFKLPEIYLGTIESMRSRGTAEQTYDHYLDEVMLEHTALKFPWRPVMRDTLSPDERSPYLEMLAANFGSPPPGVSLDPNYNLFLKLDSDTDDKWLNVFREQKIIEMEHFRPKLEILISPSNPRQRMIQIIRRIAESEGYRVKGNLKMSGDFAEFESGIDEPVPVVMRLMDLHAIEKRGHVVLQYLFPDLSSKPLGLNAFAPGGYLYSEWNKTPLAVAFSFYAQCKFLSLLRRRMAE
jgi:hypothetical protein